MCASAETIKCQGMKCALTATTMNNILLPRNYLSSSALDLWIKDPKKFKEKYFEGRDDEGSVYMDFGKAIHKMIEENKHKDLLPGLVVYPVREERRTCMVEGVPVLIIIDTYKPSINVFRDYKTGLAAWTALKVQKHDQLVFYATALTALTGKMPKYAHIDWIETARHPVVKMGLHNESKLYATGKIVSFKRIFEQAEIDRMRALIVKCANEISDAYRDWIKEI